MRSTKSFLRYRHTRDPAAFDEFYGSTLPRLRHTARQLVADVNTADDLVHGTYVAALDSIACFDGRRDVEAWLHGILMNLLRNAARSGRRELHLLERNGDRISAPAVEESPEESATSSELRALAHAKLAELREPYREVVRLRLLDGKRSIDVARILDRSASTVRTQLERGLKLMRCAIASA